METNNPLDNYEKIRTVGKGAFGVAVLYRKKSDDKLVVLKEVNTIDLSQAEFEMAMNEVDVLSSLNHPNIIGYGGSFVVQGVLMIEMEYANGGTLSYALSNRTDHIPEREILALLRQIASAIAYMHENNTLHRDLKTVNVFMNTDGCIKIGDFGIAKILNTNVQAETVLGTPYYISPEMCEGKQYDEKSDMWAVGCILYEMCCLQKTFQASSLSALVNKIMLGKYKPIPSGYSKKLNSLVAALLSKNPDDRPTAEEVYDEWIPEIISSLSNQGYDYIDADEMFGGTKNGDRTVLYSYKNIKDGVKIEPIFLPAKAKIVNVSVGKSHYIAITEEGEAFTWGEGKEGQLGLGELNYYISYPQQIDSILNKHIAMSQAGMDFTILLTKEGELLSCGNGGNGVLGHGDWNNHYKPKTIVSLLGFRIKNLACGLNHVAILTMSGDVYTWGCGKKGQIGQLSTNNCWLPTKITIQSRYEISFLELGYDASMAVTSNGSLFACGCNKQNKLSLYKKGIFKDDLMNLKIATSFEKVHYIPKQVTKCSIGKSHCNIMVKLSSGVSAVYTSGSLNVNKHRKNISYPYKMTMLDNVPVTILKCGESCTILGTDDNSILFWGLKYSEIESDKKDQNELSKQLNISTLLNGNSQINYSKKYATEFVNEPQSILALYSSPEQILKNSIISLIGIYPIKYEFFLLIKSTAPLKKSFKNDGVRNEIDDSCDTLGPLPSWIKEDIVNSEFAWNDPINTNSSKPLIFNN